MTPFAYLFIGHLIGDFLLQTSWMAKNKATHWGALVVHCSVYTLAVVLVGIWGSIDWSFIAIGLLFLSHMLLDRRTFNMWWNRVVMQNTTEKWLFVVTDQVFHLIVLAVLLHYFL
ncbi:DUF3307 domain-containing protein [Paenisporosarcina cavernae]|uniref:DUF3307 domain-containing protein n=1 Tax=Paenisporosarcina cavernae TaxID=2320858 RepID=A0A385YSP7_9BACL|nr:DUF3307 domain-containing protein [Paenisporosarcina cavernae]AYC28463.1 DUF3307 domain-containing protein [Paenisporosarcina cavernae]